MSTRTGSSRWETAGDDNADIEAQELARRRDEERRARKAAKKEKKKAAERQEPESKRARLDTQDGMDDNSAATDAATTHTQPLFSGVRTSPRWAGCRSRARFRICNRIKEGSYGWVSRATDLLTGETVALKKPRLLEPSMRRSPQGIPVSVLREISLLKLARNHPNIVTLREVLVGRDVDAVDERETEEPGLLSSSRDYPNWNPNRESATLEDGLPRPIYLVLDLVEHDLSLLIHHHRSEHKGGNRSPLFTLSESKTILQQIASGLAFLHSHWIIHRDIKPSNILLDNRGQVRIADFGLARLTSQPPTALTAVVATLVYRAPELILRKPDYHFPIDIWSLGCIFAELLADELLFVADTEPLQWLNYTDLLGLPTSKEWPEFPILSRRQKHPITTFVRPQPQQQQQQPQQQQHPHDNSTATKKRTLESLFASKLSSMGFSLLCSMLSMNPDSRPSATALAAHPYWTEQPQFKDPLLFPSFPSYAKQERPDLKAGKGFSPVSGEDGLGDVMDDV